MNNRKTFTIFALSLILTSFLPAHCMKKSCQKISTGKETHQELNWQEVSNQEKVGTFCGGASGATVGALAGAYTGIPLLIIVGGMIGGATGSVIGRWKTANTVK